MTTLEYESGRNDNGLPRKVEVNTREDKSVYVRIKQPRQDCYLEEIEVKDMLRAILKVKGI